MLCVFERRAAHEDSLSHSLWTRERDGREGVVASGYEEEEEGCLLLMLRAGLNIESRRQPRRPGRQGVWRPSQNLHMHSQWTKVTRDVTLPWPGLRFCYGARLVQRSPSSFFSPFPRSKRTLFFLTLLPPPLKATLSLYPRQSCLPPSGPRTSSSSSEVSRLVLAGGREARPRGRTTQGQGKASGFISWENPLDARPRLSWPFWPVRLACSLQRCVLTFVSISLFFSCVCDILGVWVWELAEDDNGSGAIPTPKPAPKVAAPAAPKAAAPAPAKKEAAAPRKQQNNRDRAPRQPRGEEPGSSVGEVFDSAFTTLSLAVPRLAGGVGRFLAAADFASAFVNLAERRREPTSARGGRGGAKRVPAGAASHGGFDKKSGGHVYVPF